MWGRSGFSTPPARQPDSMVDRVLADLRDHPIAAEATRRAFEVRQETRREHAAEIERLQAEEAAQLAAAQADIDAADAALAEARQALAAAERRAILATNERHRISLAGTCGLAIRRHENALHDLAEPEIDSFVAELRELQNLDRSLPLSEQHRGGAIEVISGRKTKYAQTNIPSARARAAAIDRAIQEAIALKARPDQSDLRLALDALRATIPDVKTETIRVERRSVVASDDRDRRLRRVWARSQDEEEAERRAIGAPL